MLNFLDTPKATSEPLPESPKLSEHKPKDYLLNIAKRIRTENESQRAMENARAIVQMCRRHRNMTPGDAFGFWKSGTWCESAAYNSLHNVPIFQQLIRGAEANFMNVDIRLDILATNHKKKPVERIVRDIYEVLDQRQWNLNIRQQAFYSAILMLNAYYISYFDRECGDEIPVPEFEEIGYEMGGQAICTNCYSPTDYDSKTEACPECGNESLSILSPPQVAQGDMVSGFGKQKTGQPYMMVSDGLDVSVDPNGKPGNVASLKWIEHRKQVQKDELKRLYPNLVLEGSPQWSYQTRLKKALMQYKAGEASPQTESEKTEFELRTIWLDVTEYEGYIPPEDWKIGNKLVFKRGVPAKEMYPKGMVFTVPNATEIGCVYPENKNRRVKPSLWLSDGRSPEGLGAKAGLSIQRTVNQLENIAIEGETRSLKGAVVYDPKAIDGNHLEGANTNIPLKPDFSMNEKGIGGHVLPLSVDGLSPQTLAYLASKKQTMQEVMGVPDVMVGQDTSEDPTYSGQALRNRNALGLLMPPAMSQANAKEGWLLDQLDIIQSNMSPDGLKAFGSRSGRDWQDDEIKMFFDADFEQDIMVSYTPGSEVAESRFEKQMRLRQDIGGGFVRMTPGLQAQIVRESGYDLDDPNDYDSNEKLAEKRYSFLKEAIEQMNLDAIYQQFQQQPPQVDQTGAPVQNPVIAQLMAAPQLRMFPAEENHDQMAEYWSSRVRDLAGSATDVSPLLLDVCDLMVQKHQGIAFNNAVQQAGQAGTAAAASQAPGAIGQKLLEQGATPPPPNQMEASRSRLIESISFKDLPPSGKAQLASAAGINLSVDEIRNGEKVTKQ